MNKSANRSTTAKPSKAQNSESRTASTALHELFLDELADVYNAEKQLLKALPKMAKAANSDELRQAFESHLEETQGQVGRIEELAQKMDESIKEKKCKAMEGLLKEGEEIMEENEDSPALDAALIAAAQKVEHYEIASYGTLCAWAKLLGHQDALELLQETMDEEEAADKKLTTIAETVANVEAQEQE